MIKEEEPPKPSTRLSDSGEALASISANRHTEPAKLTKLVRGELDWIVMKALEKDRNRRYETANAFAADVQRYLADEPVLACPPSAWYRLRKFARRHKAGLTMASVVTLAVLLVVGGLGWMVRDRAARQALVAGQVDLFLADVERLEREQKWPEALAAANRAEAALAGGEADLATMEKVRTVLADLELVRRLEEIRLLEGEPTREMRYDSNRRYAAVFREYGVDFEALSDEEAAARLRARPAVVIALAQALDVWAVRRGERNDEEQARRLWSLAVTIDPDPWRAELRQAIAAKNVEGLVKLAQSEEAASQPAVSQVMLAVFLRVSRREQQALALLERACELYPGDFWIHWTLAEINNSLDPKRLEAAIGHSHAARALRPQSAATWVWLGVGLYHQGKLDQASACYRKAIDLDPKDLWAHSNSGLVLQKQGKPDEAIAYYRKAIDLDPKFAVAHYNLADALKEQGKLDEAVACYRRAIDLDLKLADAHVNLGAVLKTQGKLDEAIAFFLKAIEVHPKGAVAHFNLAVALEDQGKLDEAVACYRKAVDLDPKLAAAHINLVAALMKQEKLDQAIACCQKAIELLPNDAQAHTALGNVLNAQGKLEESIACYRKAIALDPKYSKAHYNLGVVLGEQKQLDEAIVCFRKAIELDPKYTVAHHNLGIVLYQRKQMHEAIHCFRQAIDLDPKRANAHSDLGAALKMQGKLDEAIDCYRKAIDLDPKHALAHRNLGIALKTLGKADEAIACFRKAIELDPKYTAAHEDLAHTLAVQRKLDEGIASYKKVIELDPKAADAHYNLGILLGRKGLLAEAVAAYKEAIRLQPGMFKGYANWAGLLETCPDPKLRDPAEAVRLSKKAVELAPHEAFCWQTLGWGLYRTGDWKGSISALTKSIELQKDGGDPFQWFFLAMAHWKLDQKQTARKWYDQAVHWMDKNAPQDEELRRLRVEAEGLLGIKTKQP
ncbi:MAG: tetratricopeptide repeat protein [Planctomycetes bacterium]|nr:tetratricopeptide repeat protein [Planctomycetota bacterium]